MFREKLGLLGYPCFQNKKTNASKDVSLPLTHARIIFIKIEFAFERAF